MDDLKQLTETPRHVVAIVGSAVSGSEAAAVCAERGMAAVVFEQNARPYGKIEDGLPRWHDKLRDKEYVKIDANLSKDGVFFVPQTRLGQDVSVSALAQELGFSALLLANGAWRDRPLAVEGVDAYVGKGLVYQNSFVYWFNHYEDEGFAGETFEVKDGAIVIGGGLASVDVAKIINLELYRAALREKGIEISVVELEHKGIKATLAKSELTPEQLGVKGCTLYYRRRKRDMPLAFPKKGAAEEQLAKTEAVREKMCGILNDKYLINVVDCHVPVATVVEGDRLVGLTFRKTELVDGRAKEIEGSEVDIRAELIVSSIGSVPARVEGIPTKGELYHYADWDTGEVTGLPGVFGLGNVLTGKGNIKDSRINAKDISDQVIANYLGIGEAAPVMDGAHDAARAEAQEVADKVATRPVTDAAARARIAALVEERWKASGYNGDFTTWIEAHRP